MREEYRKSPHAAADAAHVAAKTEMLQLKLAEKRGDFVRQSDVDDLQALAGATLTKLSSVPGCAPLGDLATRRAIEQVVREIRYEIATACNKLVDERGEPP